MLQCKNTLLEPAYHEPYNCGIYLTYPRYVSVYLCFLTGAELPHADQFSLLMPFVPLLGCAI